MEEVAVFRSGTWVPPLLVAALLSALLAGCAAEATPPPTPMTRLDLLTDTIRCMEDLGFEAVADPFGGYTGPKSQSPEMAEQWIDASQTCMEQTGWGVEDYNDDQLAELYTLEVAQYECLLELGYSPEEPPSVQQYIDSWSSRTNSPYQPFGTVIAGLPQAEAQSILEACPPPRWSFLG